MSQKPKRVRKAVLPVAGLGTRFLPATKAMPKEMLTIVDKPLIQYAVEECIASGIEDIIFVTGRRKNAIEDHFDSAPELEEFLEERGKARKLKWCAKSAVAFISAIRGRASALGLGHAVLCAAELVGDEPFAVLLGDVIMDGPVPATRTLMDIYEATGMGAIHVEEVPRERLHFYGIIDAEPSNNARWGNRLLKVNNLVEKPKAEEAPSNLGGHWAVSFCRRRFLIICGRRNRRRRRNPTYRRHANSGPEQRIVCLHLRGKNPRCRR